MADQLDIPFPKYCFDIDKAKVSMLQAELHKCYEIIEKQKRTITTYKGHFTKRKKKTPKLLKMNIPINDLNQMLLEQLRTFRRSHEGNRPDYMLVTEENYRLIYRELKESRNNNFDFDEDDVMLYRGIPIIVAHSGLAPDTVKFVIE